MLTLLIMMLLSALLIRTTRLRMNEPSVMIHRQHPLHRPLRAALLACLLRVRGVLGVEASERNWHRWQEGTVTTDAVWSLRGGRT
eukprot:scaffold6002_cov376-Prasinococcus_capsulatus_cf.AAC.3